MQTLTHSLPTHQHRHKDYDENLDELMAGPVKVKQEPGSSPSTERQGGGGEADADAVAKKEEEEAHDNISATTATATASSKKLPKSGAKGKGKVTVKKEEEDVDSKAAAAPTTTTTSGSIVKKEETPAAASAATATSSRPRRTREEASSSTAAAASAASPTAKRAKKELKMEDGGATATSTADADDKAALQTLLDKWTQPGTLLKINASETSPYPQQERPTPFEALYARDLLAALHGEPERDKLEENCSGQGTLLEKRARSVLDSLVRTILSQNTTDALSKRAFDNLKVHFPTYKQVLAARPGEVEEVIKFAGLSEIKMERIRAILNRVLVERPEECEGGEPSLEFVRGMETGEIKEYLGGFKGVGPKTISCVLLFTIGKDDFAVDTHVWHIAKRLGWVPGGATREDTYRHLNNRIPDCVKYSLHVLLVLHGKKCVSCCKGHTQLPPDGPCPLGRVGKVRGELAGLGEAVMKAGGGGGGGGEKGGKGGGVVVKKEKKEVGCGRGGTKGKGKGKGKAPAIKKEVA